MEQTVTFSVDAALSDAFIQVAEKNACNYAELLTGFMADYVRQDSRNQQYEDWFSRKVEAGLADSEAGRVLSHEAVNVQMEAFKSTLRSKRQLELLL